MVTRREREKERGREGERATKREGAVRATNVLGVTLSCGHGASDGEEEEEEEEEEGLLTSNE